MNPGSQPFKSGPLWSAIFGLLLVLTGAMQARVTIQLYLGELDVPEGTVGILVADRGGNGFVDPTHVTVLGTKVAAGNVLGTSDDLILGVFQAGASGFTGGTGFAGVLTQLDYTQLQLTPGRDLAFFWFPSRQTPGFTLAENEAYEQFRSDANGDAPRPNAFVVPADRGVYTISYLSPANGGHVALRTPGTDGEYASGNTGQNSSHPDNTSIVDVPAAPLPPAPVPTNVAPSVAVNGTYYGLLTAPGLRALGRATVTLTNGALTLTFNQGAASYTVRGNFNPGTGAFTAAVPRTGTTPLNLTLQLGQTPNGYRITGQVVDGSDTYSIDTSRQAFTATAPSPYVGPYTMLLPAPEGLDNALYPAGHGFATATVDALGNVSAQFVLGDGTRFTYAAIHMADGEWPLYMALYGTAGGELSGKPTFRKTANVAELDGLLRWIKGKTLAPTATTVYPAGFSLQPSLLGAAYRVPAAAAGERALVGLTNQASNAVLLLEQGGVNPAIPARPLTWSATNLVAVATPTVGVTLTCTVTSATGLVSGTYANALTIPKQSVPFSGVVFQRQGLVAGNFIQGQRTGSAIIRPSGLPDLVVSVEGGPEAASGSSFDFGDVGSAGYREVSVQLTNNGTGELFLDQPIALSSSTNRFALVSERTGYLAPGKSSTVRLRFEPGNTGAHAAQLTIASNDRTNNPFTLNLSGTGVAGSAPTPLPVLYPASSDVNLNTLTHAGVYDGLITRLGVAAGRTIGTSNLRITTNTISGTMRVDGVSLTLRGTIAANGTFVNPTTGTALTGTGAAAYALDSLRLKEAAGGVAALEGVLRHVASGATYDLHFQHQPFSTAKPTTLAGTYTFLLPADPAAGEGYPGGYGSGTMTLGVDGKITCQFILGDGERFTYNGFLGSGNFWPFFMPVYPATAQGSLSGVIQFRKVANASDFDGQLQWHRPVNKASATFAYGFRQEVGIMGATYRAPISTVGERALIGLDDRAGNAQLELSQGGLAPAVNQALTWTGTNAVALSTPTIGVTLTATVTPATGLVTGTYANNNANPKQSVPFNGVIYQKQAIAAGSFVQGPQSGAVKITPSGTPDLMVELVGGSEVTSGGTVDFGDVGFEGGHREFSLRLTNQGTSSLVLDGPLALISATGRFAVTSERLGYIAPGKSSLLQLRYEPVVGGADSAQLTILSNDRTNNPFTVNFTGAGIDGNGPTPLPSIYPVSNPVNLNTLTHAGVFDGLITRLGLAAGRTIGNANLRITGNAITGTIKVDGLTLTLRGTLAADGTFVNPTTGTALTGTGAAAYVLDSLRITESAGNAAALEGVLRHVASGATYDLHFQHQPFTTAKPTTLASTYTLLLPADPAYGEGYPGGYGSGTMTLGVDGKITALMVLGDGERFTYNGFLGSGNLWPFFMPIYPAAAQGSLSGVIQFRKVDNASDFDGQLQWNRPANKTATAFAFGFRQPVGIMGATYRAPLTTVGERALIGLDDRTGNAQMELSQGGLTPVVNQVLTWTGTNTVALTTPAIGISLTATVTPATGQVTGTYANNNTNPKQSVPFTGVIYQKQAIAAGSFVQGPQSGSVKITPSGMPDLMVELVGGSEVTSGGTVDFGDVGFEGGHREFSLRLTNQGTSSLVLDGPLALVSATGRFAVTSERLGYIAPGKSSLLQLRYEPVVGGADSAQLTILSNDRTNNPFTVNFTGAGIDGNGPTPLPSIYPVSNPVNLNTLTHAGVFDGLITRLGVAAGRTMGNANLRITGNAITGTIKVDGLTLTLRGTLAADGTFVNPTTGTALTGTGAAAYVLDSLRITESAGNAAALEGVLRHVTSGATYDLHFQHQPFSTAKPTTLASTYTLLLPADPAFGEGYPGGYGSGTMTLGVDGKITALMVLGDGERFTYNGFLGSGNLWPFFMPIYPAAAQGSLSGVIQFRKVDNASDFDGQFQWNRPANKTATAFAFGFRQPVGIMGATYRAPLTTVGERALIGLDDRTGNAQMELSQGGLTPVVNQVLTWTGTNTVALTTPAIGISLTATVTPATGQVTGTYANNSTNPKQSVPFTGVIYQRQSIAAGSFVQGPQSGALKITPAGTPDLVVELIGGGALNSGDTLDFGDVGHEGGFRDFSLRLSNTGTSSLVLDRTPLLQSTSGRFALISETQGYIPAGKNSVVQVRYEPSAAGAATGQLTLFSNDRTNNPFYLNLAANGVTGNGPVPVPSPYPVSNPVNLNTLMHAGVFDGLIRPQNFLGGPTPGSANLRITGNAITGTVKMDGLTLTLRGTIAADGTFVNPTTGTALTGTGAAAYALDSLRISESAGNAASLEGVLRHIATGALYDLRFLHQPFTLAKPTTLAGTYTLLLPPDPAYGENYPGGYGSATMTMGADGKITALMVLGDGERLTYNGFLGSGNLWPFFAAIYPTTAQGSLSGVIQFRKVENVSDFDGQLLWNRPFNKAATAFAFGFRQPVSIVGAAYRAPVSSVGERALLGLDNRTGNALLELSQGGLNPAVNQTLTWTGTNTVALTTPMIGVSLTATVAPLTGQVTGTYANTVANPKQSVPFTGVIYQRQSLVGGSFLQGPRSGALKISPAGSPDLAVSLVGGGALTSGDTVDFGDVGIEGGYRELALRLTNNGTSSLVLDRAPILNVASGRIVFVSERQGYLAPGQSSLLRIRFEPSSLGADTGNFTLFSNDPTSNPFYLTMEGNAVAGTGPNTVPVIFAASTGVNLNTVAHAGVYDGLVRPLDFDGAQMIGSTNLSLTGNSVTGTMKIKGLTLTMRGTVAANGYYTGTLTGTGAAAYAVDELRIEETAPGVALMKGVLRHVDTGTLFDLHFQHRPFSATKPVSATIAKAYTMLMPVDAALGEGYPGGYGSGAVTVATNGNITGTLVLGDGERVSYAGVLGSDNKWLFYLPVYPATAQGSLSGVIQFRNIPESDFDGIFQWERPANKTATIYPFGFRTTTNALGSIFVRTVGVRSLGGLDPVANNAVLTVEGLGVGTPPAGGPMTLTWAATDVVTSLPNGLNRATITVGTNGLITGTLTTPPNTAASTISGAIFQKQNFVGGVYVTGAPAQTGSIVIDRP